MNKRNKQNNKHMNIVSKPKRFAKDLFDGFVGDLSPEDYQEDMEAALSDWDEFQTELKSRFETHIKKLKEAAEADDVEDEEDEEE